MHIFWLRLAIAKDETVNFFDMTSGERSISLPGGRTSNRGRRHILTTPDQSKVIVDDGSTGFVVFFRDDQDFKKFEALESTP